MSADAVYFFIDEAGTSTLFRAGRHRQPHVSVGVGGVSQYFILGLLKVEQPAALAEGLQALRQALLARPDLADKPSMQPQTRKTFLSFHATKDLPQVRNAVYQFLAVTQGLKFSAVVRNKWALLDSYHKRARVERAHTYNEDAVYDAMTGHGFERLLHKAGEYHLCFAQRDRRARISALRNAVFEAQQRFAKERSARRSPPIYVTSATPLTQPCLQATDYFLWAVQRCYERRDDQYIKLLWPSVSVVLDLDDQREDAAGCYYDRKRPLVAAALPHNPQDVTWK